MMYSTLQEQYEHLSDKLNKTRIRQNNILSEYKAKLVSDILEFKLLSEFQWTIGNCGWTTIRLQSNGELPPEFKEALMFILGHTLFLLPDVTLSIYSNLVLKFADIVTAIEFVDMYDLQVDLSKQVRIHELYTEILTLEQ